MEILTYSPAKLNLTLDIGEFVPACGLHRIHSLMTKITYCERLEISISKCNEGIDFSIEPAEQGCSETYQNTMYKAAQLWYAKSKLPVKINIKHDDSVPAMKGFGIGSSNAASLLKALEAFSCENGHEPLPGLQSIALATGSDVPFFLSGCTAAAIDGFGEIITPFELERKIEFLIAIPSRNASTKATFSALYADGGRKERRYKSFADLPVHRHFCELLRTSTGCDGWKLTGSGSAFFLQDPTPTLLSNPPLLPDTKFVTATTF